VITIARDSLAPSAPNFGRLSTPYLSDSAHMSAICAHRSSTLSPDGLHVLAVLAYLLTTFLASNPSLLGSKLVCLTFCMSGFAAPACDLFLLVFV
jgi:hypothetical protein